jgi:hypothetical protein
LLKRKVGIDSVFAYSRNRTSNQQVVFVEAKTVEKMDSVSRSKIENWVTDFLEKIACAPHSPDFSTKYLPDTDAAYQLGLLGLWVRDADGYSNEKIQTWLSQLNLPTRRQNPINIVFASNRIISSLCVIYQTIQSLRARDDYGSISYFFPTYGDLPAADGNCIPVEALLSKFLFFPANRKQTIKGTKQIHEYPSSIVFYSGDIKDYNDLRFIGLALKQFQILANAEIEIYTLHSPADMRNEVTAFVKEFAETGCSFVFHEIAVSDEIPGWLAE